jgi:2-polyprenyl-6-methoxyphenol hydroxylase-like FAD-dependent oxidoreductase
LLPQLTQLVSMPRRRRGSDISVAIVGAGLSGLCLAQSLRRAGLDVQVFERDPSPHARRQGYRITLDEHGASALKKCLPPDKFEAVLATASSGGGVGYFRFTNQQLGEIFKLTFKHDGRSSGREVIGQVDRSTLRTIMLAGLEDRTHFGKAAVQIVQAPDGATIRFADGSSMRASVVIGADGIHSRVREQLLTDCPVIDTGSRGIYGKTPLVVDGRSLVPRSLETSGVLALGGLGRAFFFTSMRFNNAPNDVFARLVPDQEPPVSGDYVMWALMFPKEGLPSDVLELKAAALHRLALDGARHFHPVLRNFVENADVDYTVATTLSAATRPKNWSGSRVTLMGDAVHVMPPTGAHGGNTALRDAALLAEELQNAAMSKARMEKAIQAYQQAMITYAFKEVERSTAMLRWSNIKNPAARFVMLKAVPWLRSLAGASLTSGN